MDLRIEIKIAEHLSALAMLEQCENFHLFIRLEILEHFGDPRRIVIRKKIDQVGRLAVPDDFAQIRNQQRIPHR
jgi:hypothetical protein